MLVAHDAGLRVIGGHLPRPICHPLSQYLTHKEKADSIAERSLATSDASWVHPTTGSSLIYLSEAIRVDRQQHQEVLDRVDFVGRKLAVELTTLADLLEPPYRVVQSWRIMLLVRCTRTVLVQC